MIFWYIFVQVYINILYYFISRLYFISIIILLHNYIEFNFMGVVVGWQEAVINLRSILSYIFVPLYIIILYYFFTWLHFIFIIILLHNYIKFSLMGVVVSWQEAVIHLRSILNQQLQPILINVGPRLLYKISIFLFLIFWGKECLRSIRNYQLILIKMGSCEWNIFQFHFPKSFQMVSALWKEHNKIT